MLLFHKMDERADCEGGLPLIIYKGKKEEDKMSEASERIRKSFKESDDIRDAGLTTPDDIVRYDNILYGTIPQWQILDVYRPKNAFGKKLPVIVSVHGGAWVYGDKERYQYYCMNLSQRGFAVVNFTYRLAPEYKFPASLEDTNLVFRWVLEHAEEYCFDTDNIFGVGDSAGAHILSLYAVMCTNQDCALQYDFKPAEGFIPKGIGLNCGKYEMKLEDEDKELMEDFLEKDKMQEEIAQINVVDYITSKFPPVYLMTATEDFLKRQSLILTQILAEKNVPFEFHFYGSMEKGLGHVFHINIKTEEAKQCNDEECHFFRKLMEK